MIKINELTIGDYVICEFEGNKREGEVTGLNRANKQIAVTTDVQEFWFEEEHLFPIPLDEQQLFKMHFTLTESEVSTAKYVKGPFRIVLPQKGNFEHMEVWYREDKRHNPNIHYVHQLQNAYLDMTKVHLTDTVVV